MKTAGEYMQWMRNHKGEKKMKEVAVPGSRRRLQLKALYRALPQGSSETPYNRTAKISILLNT